MGLGLYNLPAPRLQIDDNAIKAYLFVRYARCVTRFLGLKRSNGERDREIAAIQGKRRQRLDDKNVIRLFG